MNSHKTIIKNKTSLGKQIYNSNTVMCFHDSLLNNTPSNLIEAYPFDQNV